MRFQIAEIIGVALVLAALCTLIAAAALVSTALAVAVAGGFLLLIGGLTVYVAAALEARSKAAEQSERRTP